MGTPPFRKQVREEKIQRETRKEQADREEKSHRTRVGKFLEATCLSLKTHHRLGLNNKHFLGCLGGSVG